MVTDIEFTQSIIDRDTLKLAFIDAKYAYDQANLQINYEVELNNTNAQIAIYNDKLKKLNEPVDAQPSDIKTLQGA